MEKDELLRIVREVGREILEKTPGVVQKQTELSFAVQAQLGTENKQESTVVRKPLAWLSLVKHFQSARELGIPEGKDIRYNLGEVEEGLSESADVSRELKDGSINPANALIKTIRKGEIMRARPYTGFPHPKTGQWVPVGIKPDLDKLAKDNPQFSQQFAESIERMVLTGQIPKGMSDHAELVAEVTALWFGQEPARDPANIVMSVINLDLVKQGKLSMGEAIKEHPASTFGYQEAAKELNDDLHKPPGEQVKVKKAKQRIIDREIATLQRWFEAKFAADQLNDVNNNRESIKRLILEIVNNFYRI